MNHVLAPYHRKFLLVFFDDILIYNKDWGRHLQYLRKVLELLRKHKLYAKMSKLLCSAVDRLLGHVIPEKGVATSSKGEMHESIACVYYYQGRYYRKFIKSYGLISKPLTSLLKKDAFTWNVEAGIAFKQLKSHGLDFSKTFVVETDASGRGVGVVLMQEGKPIAYSSKALAAKNLGLSAYVKEFLALLLVVTRLKHYLQGNHFIIRTDQRSPKHILDQRVDSILQ
ncbi:UNVERIFIED_CONTAM: hypothetical protein Slati_2895200 [Sesamum latifolium]|uniref:Reverse transcriptase domain-containing protein n=1 Tax=Sesamum latifolium TaxID=2727402 RepID=A0AAW2VCE8_9LAMI